MRKAEVGYKFKNMSHAELKGVGGDSPLSFVEKVVLVLVAILVLYGLYHLSSYAVMMYRSHYNSQLISDQQWKKEFAEREYLQKQDEAMKKVNVKLGNDLVAQVQYQEDKIVVLVFDESGAYPGCKMNAYVNQSWIFHCKTKK